MSTAPVVEAVPPHALRHLHILVCPVCQGRLRPSAGGVELACSGCGRSFRSENGIPLLFWPTGDVCDEDVTEQVKAFYEQAPFPDYEADDDTFTLREKAGRSTFARLLDEQIPPGARVLEVGCGTGQLSNFMGSLPGRSVVGADICLNSLSLAEGFRHRNGIQSASFVQMNLFRPAFAPESFDFVISNGVLHHTANPYEAFRSILRLLKPRGYVIVGLYNRYGRLWTDLRRLVFRLTGDRLTLLDPRLRTPGVGQNRKRAWFLDQYKHPHESKHTIGEVQRWFHETGVLFISSIPKAVAFEPFTADESLFTPNPPGTRWDHFVVQLGMALSGGREGGFYVMTGRKRSEGRGATASP